jgi:very-short-patch-repair endonuclease
MLEPVWDQQFLKERGLITDGHSLPYNPNLIERANELRKKMTPAERKLWIKLFRNYPMKILRQRVIDNFIVDFYCAKRKLVLEIDGSIHDLPEVMVHDEERTKILQEYYGLRVIRVTNSEVEEEFERVCQVIRDELGIVD